MTESFAPFLDWVSSFVADRSEHDLRLLPFDDAESAVARQVLYEDAYRRAVQSLWEDGLIRRLLPSSPTAKGPMTFAYLVGRGLTPDVLPMAVIASSVLECLVREEPLSPDAIRAAAMLNLRKLQAIAKGHHINCTLVTGFHGFSLPTGARITSDLGTLSAVPPEPSEMRRLLGMGRAEPSAMLTSVLTAVPTRVQLPDEPPTETDMEAHDRADLLTTKFAVALLLATALESAESQIIPTALGQLAVLPFTGVLGAWSASESMSWALSQPRKQPLTEEERGLVTSLAQALNSPAVEHIRVALKRILSAATWRQLPGDVLIDSVTAWESLVGSDQETTARVTLSLAWLLEETFDKRGQRVRDLRRIYGTRSKVVHGEPRSLQKVHADGRAALEVAKRALYTILVRDSWLLSLPKSSQRSEALLLGDPRLRGMA